MDRTLRGSRFIGEEEEPTERLAENDRETEGARTMWNLKNEGRECIVVPDNPKKSSTKRTEMSTFSKQVDVHGLSDFWAVVRAGTSLWWVMVGKGGEEVILLGDKIKQKLSGGSTQTLPLQYQSKAYGRDN